MKLTTARTVTAVSLMMFVVGMVAVSALAAPGSSSRTSTLDPAMMDAFDSLDGSSPRLHFWAGKGDMKLASMVVDGLKREYYIYRPAGKANYPLPTLLVFHGHGGTARGTDKFTGGITSLADKEGFLVVFPDGIKKSWLDGREVNAKPARDDVKFISTLIDRLVASKLTDSHRVYVAGMSNGGFFSQYLALHISEKLAGVASIGASLATVHEKLKGRPVPMMYILGTRDPLVPWSGGKIGFKHSFQDRGQCVPATRAISFWLENNGLTSSEQSMEQLPDTNKKDRSTIRRTIYRNGNPRSDMEVYQVDNGGHTWPGGWQYLPPLMVGVTNRDVNANDVIWDFFKGHRI